jgi:glycine/D-amino acid oxidase-like deaminating enzyme
MTPAFAERNLWAQTAVSAPPTGPLRQDERADVTVVGAGYAGLSTALHLAEQGAKVVVLEAATLGFGGSGRNGGQVIPGLKFDPDELEARFGSNAGQALIAFCAASADAVFALIGRLGLAVPNERKGWIQAAHDAKAAELVASRAAQWQARGAAVDALDRQETRRLLGSAAYSAGWLDRRGGSVQPLSYARELGRAALAAGAGIYTQSPVKRMAREAGRWTLSTPSGANVTSDKVILCTNAYSEGLWPGLERTIVAANSFQVASDPLSEACRATILPFGQACSDTRRLLLYFRLDHQGRFLIGGRGPFRAPRSNEDWAHLEQAAQRLYPQLKATPFPYRWSGRVAITQDFLPHLHEPEPGLVISIGCQGRGVGLQTAMGMALAAYCRDGDQKRLPFAITRPRPLPLAPLKKAYIAALVQWYRWQDRHAPAA